MNNLIIAIAILTFTKGYIPNILLWFLLVIIMLILVTMVNFPVLIAFIYIFISKEFNSKIHGIKLNLSMLTKRVKLGLFFVRYLRIRFVAPIKLLLYFAFFIILSSYNLKGFGFNFITLCYLYKLIKTIVDKQSKDTLLNDYLDYIPYLILILHFLSGLRSNPKPKPQTPNPKPQTPNPKTQSPNPKPQTPKVITLISIVSSF